MIMKTASSQKEPEMFKNILVKLRSPEIAQAEAVVAGPAIGDEVGNPALNKGTAPNQRVCQ